MRTSIGYLVAACLYLAVLLPLLVVDGGSRPHPRAYLLEFRGEAPTRLVGDAILNLAVFVPLGWLLCRGIHDVTTSVRARVVIVVGFCAALSLTVETWQYFLLSRYSSLIDVLTNTTGALAGAGVACRGHRR